MITLTYHSVVTYHFCFPIGHVTKHSTMCYFGISRHTQSLTAYKMLTQYFWDSRFQLHCGNAVCIVSYRKNGLNHKYDCTDIFHMNVLNSPLISRLENCNRYEWALRLDSWAPCEAKSIKTHRV
mgnify:FL=1